MSHYPSGWVKTSLGHLIELKYGKALPDRERSGDGFPVFGSNGVVGYHKSALTAGATVVIGRKGSVGEVNFSEIPCSPIDTTYYVDSFPGSQSKYWYYKLLSLPLKELNKSTAIPGVSRSDVYPLEITLPPLPEQKRIADKLDSALARVDACRDRLDRLPALIKRFRQSILAAATSGRLTEDWQTKIGSSVSELQESGNHLNLPTQTNSYATEYDFQIPVHWILCSISDITEVKGGKRLPFGEELTSEKTPHPYIRAGQLKNGSVDNSNQLYLSEQTYQKISRYTVKNGDVYITIVGACIGDAGVIPDEFNGSNLTENAAKLCEFKKPTVSKFLAYWLRSPQLQAIISAEIKSGAQGKLALMRIKQFPIPYPPIDEQTEIVRRVELLFAFADRLEARLATARRQVGQLTPALLAKAFRGELVAQDPADEPAAELLKRLAAQREAAPKAKRGRAKA